ncbi:hypothetical protein ACQQ97_06685, partial [Anaerovoracaceae bacterium SGI.195]
LILLIFYLKFFFLPFTAGILIIFLTIQLDNDFARRVILGKRLCLVVYLPQAPSTIFNLRNRSSIELISNAI